MIVTVSVVGYSQRLHQDAKGVAKMGQQGLEYHYGIVATVVIGVNRAKDAADWCVPQGENPRKHSSKRLRASKPRDKDVSQVGLAGGTGYR